MSSNYSLGREARVTMALALPLVIGQVGQMLIGVADTVMIGQVGKVPLAAATFANTVVHVPFMFGIGMAIAVSVRVSQARGANDPERARAAVRHGLFVTLALGLLSVVFALVLLPFLPVFGQKPEVLERVPVYFLILGVSMIPAMATMALKNFADAMNHPWPAFWVMLGGVVLNVFLNWVFIYGNLGAPRLELEGAGVATVIARTATLVGLLVLCRCYRPFRGWVPARWLRPPDWPALRRLVKIGLPASLQLSAEMSCFIAATLIIGTMSIDALAAHQVAITCAATIFMVPLGLSQALTVRIGEAWGARRFHRWRPIVTSGWLLTLGFAVCSAGGFYLLHEVLAKAFLPKEPETAAVAAGLLLVAVAFVFGDAFQVVAAGALRGLSDVRIPAWIAFFAFWAVAIPFGWWLSFGMGMGVYGMWWGLTAGLFLVAVTLGARLWIKTGPGSFAEYERNAPDDGES